jgi:PAS domain S-box-containing protein
MLSDTGPEQHIPGLASKRRRLYIAFIYAVLTALWILLSDKAIAWLFSDPALIALAGTLNGWLFAGVTWLLLYVLTRRWTGFDAAPKLIPADSRRLALHFALLALVIVVLTGAAIFNAFTRHKETEIALLEAIADMKTRQITDWLGQRQGEADIIKTSDFFAELYRSWQSSGDMISAEKLQTRLEEFRQISGFTAVMLLNPKGEKLWGSEKSPLTLAPPLLAAIQQAKTERKVLLIGPYRGLSGNLHLDFVVPLTAMPDQTPLVILHLNLSNWLFPFLQTWPVLSANGETLLFRRNGNQVLYLNELLHRKNSAVNFHLPSARKQLLAAQVLRGEIAPGSPLVGTDYRGIPAIGVARAIPGTDWFLVVKLDKSELYAETLPEVTWIALVGLLVLFIACGWLYLSRQGQQLALSKAVQQSQEERLKTLSLLAAIADSSHDAIFAKDLEGRYTLFNRAAGQLFSIQSEDVLGCDDRAIFPPEQADRLMDLNRRVIARNTTITAEEVFKSPEGERILLATKGPLRDAEGKVIGLFGISHDITALKQTERNLLNSEERFRWFFKLSPIPLNIINKTTVITAANKQFVSTFGYTLEDVPTLAEWWLLAYPDTDYRLSIMDTWNAAVQRMMERNIVSEPIEAHVTCKDGVVRTVMMSGIIIGDEILTAFVDITELRLALIELQQRNDELERFNRVTIGREQDMISLKQQINALSRQVGQEPPYPLSFLDTPPEQPQEDDAQ